MLIKIIFSLLLFFGKHELYAPDTTYSTSTTLTSDQRLQAASRAILNATLTVNGNGYNFIFPSAITTPVFVVNASFTATIQNCFFTNFHSDHLTLNAGSSIIFSTEGKIRLSSSQTLTKALQFGPNSQIQGDGNILTLGSGGSIRVNSGGSLKISNLTIVGVTAANFFCADNTASLTLENVNIVMTTAWTFSAGIMSLLGNNLISGPYTFAYTSTVNSTINANSSLKFDRGTNFNFAPATGATPRTNLVFADATSTLHLDGCTLTIPNTGMQVRKGTLEVSREVVVENTATSTQYDQGLVLGTGSFANDAWPVINPGANLKVNSGMINYKNEEVNPPVALNNQDYVTIKNVTYNTYLYVPNQTPPSSSTAVAKTIPVFPGSEWRVDIIIGGSPLQSGSTVVFRPGAAGAASFYGLRSDYGTAAPVSSPAPPYYLAAVGTASLTSQYYFTVNKISGVAGTTIYVGDLVELVSPSPTQYLSSNNLSYLGDFETFMYRAASRPATGALWTFALYP